MLQWEDRLSACETQEEVLFVASDFLASLDYLQIARLPRACRPRLLATAPELVSYMSELASCAATRARGTESSELILRLLLFFSHATDRLAILDPAVAPQGPAKRSA